MTVTEFEDAVWRVENIRIVLRAGSAAQVEDYEYTNAASQTWTLNEWLAARVNGRVGDYEVEIIKGDGERAHRGQLVRTTRAGYAHG